MDTEQEVALTIRCAVRATKGCGKTFTHTHAPLEVSDICDECLDRIVGVIKRQLELHESKQS